jgi:hypothetical protein
MGRDCHFKCGQFSAPNRSPRGPVCWPARCSARQRHLRGVCFREAHDTQPDESYTPLRARPGLCLRLQSGKRLLHAVTVEAAAIGDPGAERASEPDRKRPEVRPRLLHPAPAVGWLESVPPAGDRDQRRRHPKREPSAAIGRGHCHESRPAATPRTIASYELRADMRPTTAKPAATSALGAPLAHPRQVADKIIDNIGRGTDDFRDRNAVPHSGILTLSPTMPKRPLPAPDFHRRG